MDCITRTVSSIMAAMLVLGCAMGTARGQSATAAATRQYAAAVRLQNLESYDLAADAWRSFLETNPTDPRLAKAHHNLGVCYYQEDKLSEALATFHTVVQQHPDFEKIEAALLYLGVTQYSLAGPENIEKYTEAAETFNTLVTRFPEGKHRPDALYYLADCAYLSDRLDDAVRLYSGMLTTYPDSGLAADAMYALGVAREDLGDAEAAGATYDTFLKRFPDHPLAVEVGMRRGETLFAAERFEEAISFYAKAAAAPGFELADFSLFRQAESLSRLKHHTEAAAIYASLVERFPQSEHTERALLAGGKCHFLAGSHPDARAMLSQLLDPAGPARYESAHWTAQSLLRENQPAKALAVIERVLPIPEDHDLAAQLLMDRADAVYEIPERSAESIPLYASLAVEHEDDPQAAHARYMAAFAALEQTQYSVALSHANGFLGRHEAHDLTPDVLHIAAESSLQLLRLDEAIELYDQALKNYGDHPDADLWKVRHALALYLRKEYKKTIALLEPMIDGFQAPEQAAEAQYLLGASHAALEQDEPAARWLAKSLETNPAWPRSDETLMALASVYRRMGKNEAASDALSRLLKEFPESRLAERAFYRLGEYSYTDGDHASAVTHYQALIERFPRSTFAPHALHEWGCAELNSKNPAAAIVVFDRLIESHPKHEVVVEARYARAVAQQQTKQYAEAIADLQFVLESGDDQTAQSDILYMLGLCQLGLDQHEAAAGTFRRLLSEDPAYSGADNAHYQLAWSLRLDGKPTEAAEAFAELAEAFPDSDVAAEAHHHVGEHAYQEKDYAKAVTAYHAAMTKAGPTPLGEKATHKLGWSYFHQDDFENAEKTFARQTAAYPDGPLLADARFMFAESLFQQEKFEKAFAAYGQVEGLTNNDFQSTALLHTGQAAAQLKKWQESLTWLQQLTGLYPESPLVPEALYEQGWAHQNLDQPDKAVELYQQTLEKSTGEAAARAQFMIGELEFADGEHADAIRSYFKVIYGYGYPRWQADATYEAARCFEVLKKPSQAVKLYQELIDNHPKSDKVSLAEERISELATD